MLWANKVTFCLVEDQKPATTTNHPETGATDLSQLVAKGLKETRKGKKQGNDKTLHRDTIINHA
jgi:hypothetical protein